MAASETLDIAKVSLSLIDRDSYLNLNSDTQLGRKLYFAYKALGDLVTDDPTSEDLDIINNLTFSLCGGYAFEAEALLNQGGSGIIINPSTGTASLADIYSEFTVGDVGSLLDAGETTFTINIGAGNIPQMGVFQITLDGVSLPRNNNTRISYSVSYAAGVITVVLNQGAENGQLYVVSGTYLIV
jgi:hypothetical protein